MKCLAAVVEADPGILARVCVGIFILLNWNSIYMCHLDFVHVVFQELSAER